MELGYYEGAHRLKDGAHPGLHPAGREKDELPGPP